MFRFHINTPAAYVIGLFVVIVWGITFVNTKVLIQAGLTPSDILFYRSALAWAGLVLIFPRPFFAKNIKDELLLVLMGLFGGSVYFLLENTALSYTLAANVSLLVCTTPIITVLFGMTIVRSSRPALRFWLGTLAAIVGVAIVVFNGAVHFEVNPLGDMLALLAACAWAVYSLLLKRMSQTYEVGFITLKVLFYTMLTITPYFTVQALNTDFSLILSSTVLPHFLFLGLVAQTLCFNLWTVVVKIIGPIRSNNLLYLSPVTTMVTAYLVLSEGITLTACLGCALILIGIAATDSGLQKKD